MRPLLAILGAACGGAIGFFATGWLARQGLYSVLLPGAFIGFGSLLGRFPRGITFPVLLGAAAIFSVYFTEWHYFPFARDRSLAYFFNHLGSLKPLTHVMAWIGGIVAFWLPFNHARKIGVRRL